MNPQDTHPPAKQADTPPMPARIRAQIAAFFSATVAAPQDPGQREKLEKRHDECSRNLRNSVLTFSAFAAICWVALAKSDIELISAQSTVKIAILQLEVTLDNFLAVIPMVMLLLLVHSSVFRLRLNALDFHVVPENRFSALFNLPGPMARLATFFLHVAVPLGLIAFLIVKTSHRGGFGINLAISALSLILVCEVHMMSKWTSGRPYGRVAYVLAAVILFAGSIFNPVTDWLRSGVMYLAPLDFREVDFTDRQKLILSGRQFPFANFADADLTEANLIRANLSGANLSEANLSKATLELADLRGAFLSKANVSGADLREANLSGADLRKANLSDAYLSEANLSDANLDKAKLIEANLYKAILIGANLIGADLWDANLRGANLRGANLWDADLRGVKNLTQKQLEGAEPTPPPRNLPKGPKGKQLTWPFVELDGKWVRKE